MNAGRDEPERTQRMTEPTTTADSGLYGDGETIAASNPDADGEIETTKWPSSAPDPDELTENQQRVIQTAQASLTEFDTLGELTEQCPTARSHVRRTLRDHWPKAHAEIKDERAVPKKYKSETDATEAVRVTITINGDGSDRICISCAESWADASRWQYCPQCGEQLQVVELEPVTGGDAE
jgi:hypothetical protein